ncbi:Lsr2 family protein [Actinoplanes sp. NPDC051633]|uniref:histone-like nucleoid-structuring protein Lsr2 n=1 Tax=Actinoplanes sp. NPDC051633 TaxID=3155670 RepID=UPI0034169CE8
MATRTEEIVIDDLDGSTDDVGTCRFTIDGVEYKIDLSAANRQRLQDALTPFITAARRLPNRRPSTAGRTQAVSAHAVRVRRWWAEHQTTLQLPAWRANGRVPKAVYQAFNAN